ncbi:MAG: histidinol-phosphate transaminase [Rhodanobacteraceae bacterium]|nr:histidinol-phosphate transaminase [Rhodanobacteraceae bacterium]
MSGRPDFVAQAIAPLRKLVPYDPGHDLPAIRRQFAGRTLAELGSNENPWGPSPRVLERCAQLDASTLLRYPDPLGFDLRRALAARLGVDADEIVLGNGSHELLMLLAQAFAGPGDRIVFSEFGFAVFPISTATVGATPVRVPALPLDHPTAPRGHDLDAIAAAVTEDTKLVFIANPNNPTGTWFSRRALADFMTKIPAHVPIVFDEAYHEYVTDPDVGSAIELRARFPNVIVTRTFSKAYGLAGLRVGYLVAAADGCNVLNRVRESFNVNGVALALAEAALADQAHVASVRARTQAQVAALSHEIRGLDLFVHPSQTNFVLADFGREAAPIEAKLLAQGAVVRPMKGYGLPTCLRINNGTEADDTHLLDCLKEALR